MTEQLNREDARNMEPINTAAPQIVSRLGQQFGFTPEAGARPNRCRAIIFNPDGSKVLGIQRIKPGRDPYVVYPGGGLEDTDVDAKAGVFRELQEELGLNPADVVLSGAVLEHEGEYFYVGHAPTEFTELTIGGPEAERDAAVSGSYLPGWFDIATLVERNTFPTEISEIIQHGATEN